MDVPFIISISIVRFLKPQCITYSMYYFQHVNIFHSCVFSSLFYNSINPTSVPILFSVKTPENLWFYGVFMRHKKVNISQIWFNNLINIEVNKDKEMFKSGWGNHVSITSFLGIHIRNFAFVKCNCCFTEFGVLCWTLVSGTVNLLLVLVIVPKFRF